MGEITGEVKVNSSTLVWKIENFSKKCSKVGEFIVSPIFQFGDRNKKTCWNLQLNPFGYNLEAKDYLSVFLTFLPQSTTSKYVCSYKMSVLDVTKAEVSTLECIEKIFCTDRVWGWRKFMKRSELIEKKNTLLKDDTLTISCSITEISTNEIGHSVTSVADEYQTLFETGDFSDVTIVIGDKKIKAHKAILSTRSKVFSAMLRHDMTEIIQNIINISDVEFDVMEKFLSFLYSGKFGDDNNFALPLLLVANKYDVSNLKLLCENILLSTATVDNACDIVRAAELCNCSELKPNIIQYIIENMSEIVKTEGFDDLLSSEQSLFKEIFIQLLETSPK